MCQKWYTNVNPKKKSYEPDTTTCQKPYKFDLEVKGKHCIGITNVRDISSYGDTSMCQILVSQCQSKKKVMNRTRTHVKNPINDPDVKGLSRIGITWTHRFIVIHPLMIEN